MTKRVQNQKNFQALKMNHLILVQLKEKKKRKTTKTRKITHKITLKNLKKSVNPELKRKKMIITRMIKKRNIILEKLKKQWLMLSVMTVLILVML